MKLKTRLLIESIVFTILFLADFVLLIVVGISDKTEQYKALYYSLAIILPFLAVAMTIAIFRYVSALSTIRSRLRENKYNLGKETSLYDMAAFRLRVVAVRRFASKKKKEFIMVFSAANQSVTENIDRNDSVSEYNLKVADYIDSTFKKDRKNSIFCFNRGLFILYLRGIEEKKIRELVGTIANELVKIAEENQVRIWIQPFFGAYEMNREDTVISAVENAEVARNVSERNFETLTYYHESFRRRSSTSDTEEITQAIKNKEFVVYYQPKFSLTAKRFISSEALVRWHSPKHGILFPNKFIPLAEAAGLIHEIDTYVFERVCQDINEAKRKGRRVIPVSINFSLYEFYSNDFLNSIMDLLEKYQINPSYIEIEITEATSQANTFISISIIKKLRDRGIRVLMDDFGVGFSNIGNLRKIPFDAVKIDKSFIDDIVTDMKSRDIVRFLIELCKVSDMEVIAEGVDNKEQVEILRKYKCDTIQGFYYSEALPLKEYEKFLLSNQFERREEKN